MGQLQRAGHMDVSNTVDVSDPVAVAGEVHRILENRYEGFDFSPIDLLVRDFSRLYRGSFPGFRACDIKYHDIQHVLDVTLAMARLLDGHDSTHDSTQCLGPELALAGIAAALFHDSGYIRRTRDSRNKNGAAYTRVHVSRGARFMTDYLPSVGLQHCVGVCTRIIHFTGYEIDPWHIEVDDECEYRLGVLLGTADLIAQMADVDYVRKCRDHLYEEFEAGGMAGEFGLQGNTGTVYRSPDHLLETTPNFMRKVIDVRLNGHFDSVHRYAAEHFGGRNLYMDAIAVNYSGLEAILAGGGSAKAPA
ncbi:MAG: hypothetical protein DRQ98_08855 [Gammaproteobacteria bacterium]|nr:MAG: hypothetical protein DRQ98_08855 [Gammaproteobacteria bacterium]